ncbi:MAG: flagellar biosynthesis protein FlhA [Phycisphaerales bacterium]|nr:flagellar biosynthesis protein FlhA [Phycisphaerales bacterium]
MAERAIKPGGSGDGLPAWMRRMHRHKGLIVPLGFVMLLVVILVPLPPLVMDLLISGNISLAVIILLTTIYMSKPLDFSVFPSLLLATTMLRLVLNIASTRLILTADAAGPEEAIGVAGKVISAFGEFVAGDSLFVGVVIFLLLVIVQFVVITKGASRIAEVAARFTLDAMPGKQMAIDSDLNAGIINEADARRRREEIAQEADFFGAMDGASKFVRGDAVAGIIITGLNIGGGLAVGIIERGWPFAQTASVFTKLTIGDGLTSQIPSFIISIAAALIVTRSGAKEDLGEELTGQLMSQPRGLAITAIFLALLALTPLPTVPLLATGAGLGLLAFGMFRAAKSKAAQARDAAVAQAQTPPEPPPIENLLKVDTMELEIGFGLVALVDAGQGGDLLDRIGAIRRQIAAEIGLVTPPIRIRDNMQLEPGQYRVKIRGAVVAQGELKPGMLMAMDSGIATGKVQGERTREPAFGLDAWWIERAQRHRAETMNYTVVDPTSVLATHLTEIVKQHAHELLTREEVNNLLENLRAKSPKLVEEAIPAAIKVADLQRVLHNLLRERVPIRDMESIIETLADWGPKTKDVDILTEYVRNALRRVICEQYAAPGENGKPRLVCVTLDPAFEDHIASYIERGPAGTSLSMPARVATRAAELILRALQRVTAGGHHAVVIASPQVRAQVRQILEPHLATAAVLGYNEIPPGVEVESVGLVSPEPAGRAAEPAAA